MEQIQLIGSDSKIYELPSAKLKKVDKSGVHGWVSFYAAFSERFADSALSALGVSGGDVVFDPFLGSGTSGVSACKAGASFVGWDLDPFACILSRAKTAVTAKPEKVVKYLQAKRSVKNLKFDCQALEVFDQACLEYAGAVFSSVRKKVQGGRKYALENICDDESGCFDSEAVVVAALCIAASRAAKLIKGSNPTWYRQGVPGEADSVEELRNGALKIACQMLSDLKDLKLFKKSKRIFNCDSTREAGKLEDGSADYVLTSPPYLTRIDYVINHLPNLLLLSGFVDIDIKALRSKMIGTSRILEKSQVDPEWGGVCLEVLKRISEHGSYASERYYYWTYLQYFRSIFMAIKNIRKKLKVEGKGVMVVQASFYKDVHVPLSEIIIEMMASNSIKGELVRVEEVKVNMRTLQAARMSQGEINKRPSEDVIFFTRLC